jgi:surface carbohydrate biosynthesis protein (TIGR04326 family)
MDPLEEILHKYDISFSSNMTSAAVDAFFYGLPSIVILDSMGLNLSPLRGQSNVNFVSTPEELAELIQSVNIDFDNISPSNNFFFLDPSLPRWQKLLDLSIKICDNK